MRNEQDRCQQEFIRAALGQISIWRTGHGSPVVFVHGFSTSASTWKPLCRYLPNGMRYFFVDLPCHGESDRLLPNPLCISTLAEQLADILRAMRLSHYSLVGHSLGGLLCLLATEALLKRGELIPGKLILIDTPAVPQEMPRIIRFFANRPLSSFTTALLPKRTLVRLGEADVFYRPSAIPAGLVEDYARALARPQTIRCLQKIATAIASDPVLIMGRRAAPYPCPTLLIWGAHDRLVPNSSGPLLKASLSTATLVTIPDAGHAPHEEQPSATAEAMSRFLLGAPQ